MGNKNAVFLKTVQDLKKNDPLKSNVNFSNYALGEFRIKKLLSQHRAEIGSLQHPV
eukprot:m.352155 g.352155  ORF g.352155 m.352155 type:complete len:56 (+) comp57369_c0_seq1:99-266(+)